MRGLLLGLAGLLIGCGSSDERAFTHYLNSTKGRVGRPIESIPEFKPLPQFLYPENDKRRSPFKPTLKTGQTEVFAPNIKRPKQPLESFPLDALKFVGTLTEGHARWALIKQPGGLVIRVRPGDYMGQQYGQIIQVNDKVLTVEEALQREGKWEKKQIEIRLNVPD